METGEGNKAPDPARHDNRPWEYGNEKDGAAALTEMTLPQENVRHASYSVFDPPEPSSALCLSARCPARLISSEWVSWASLGLANRRHCHEKVGRKRSRGSHGPIPACWAAFLFLCHSSCQGAPSQGFIPVTAPSSCPFRPRAGNNSVLPITPGCFIIPR